MVAATRGENCSGGGSTMNIFKKLFNGITALKSGIRNRKNDGPMLSGISGFDSDSDDDCENEFVYTDRREEMMLLDAKFGSNETHLPIIQQHLQPRNNQLDYLGHGGFSIVKKCWSEKHETDVAIKIILMDKENNNLYLQKYLPRELEIWGEISKFQNQNILRMIENFTGTGFTYVVMDVVDNGDLSTLMKFGALTEHKSRSIFRGLFEAVHFLHKLGIAHRDIKPENLLLTKRNEVKLADFTFVTKDNPVSSERCGTPGFLAPEQRDCGYYDPFKSDMWQVGLTLYYMFFGDMPFTSSRKKHLIDEIASCRNKYRNVPMPTGRMLSKDAKDLVAGMLQLEIDNRWNIQHVKASYWLNPTERNLVNRTPVNDSDD
ncbi:testis-specific serine/threonine-protein kinase 3-like [Clytia hemisphaerica]